MQKGPGQEIAMNYDNTAAQTDRGTVGRTDWQTDSGLNEKPREREEQKKYTNTHTHTQCQHKIPT